MERRLAPSEISDIIEENRPTFRSNLNLSDATCDLFLESGLITLSVADEIKSFDERNEKIKVFLDYLTVRLQRFDDFCDVLHLTGHGFLSDYLRILAKNPDFAIDKPLVMYFFNQLKPLIDLRVPVSDIFTYLTHRLKEFIYTIDWRSGGGDDKQAAMDAKEQQLLDSLVFKERVNKQNEEMKDMKIKMNQAIANAEMKGAELKALAKYLTELKEKHERDISSYVANNSATESHLRRLEKRVIGQEAIAKQIYTDVDNYLKDFVQRKFEHGELDTYFQEKDDTFLFTTHDQAKFVVDRLFTRIAELEELRDDIFDFVEIASFHMRQLGLFGKEKLDLKTGLKTYLEVTQNKIQDLKASNGQLIEQLEVALESQARVEATTKKCDECSKALEDCNKKLQLKEKALLVNQKQLAQMKHQRRLTTAAANTNLTERRKSGYSSEGRKKFEPRKSLINEFIWGSEGPGEEEELGGEEEELGGEEETKVAKSDEQKTTKEPRPSVFKAGDYQRQSQVLEDIKGVQGERIAGKDRTKSKAFKYMYMTESGALKPDTYPDKEKSDEDQPEGEDRRERLGSEMPTPGRHASNVSFPPRRVTKVSLSGSAIIDGVRLSFYDTIKEESQVSLDREALSRRATSRQLDDILRKKSEIPKEAFSITDYLEQGQSEVNEDPSGVSFEQDDSKPVAEVFTAPPPPPPPSAEPEITPREKHTRQPKKRRSEQRQDKRILKDPRALRKLATGGWSIEVQNAMTAKRKGASEADVNEAVSSKNVLETFTASSEDVPLDKFSASSEDVSLETPVAEKSDFMRFLREIGNESKATGVSQSLPATLEELQANVKDDFKGLVDEKKVTSEIEIIFSNKLDRSVFDSVRPSVSTTSKAVMQIGQYAKTRSRTVTDVEFTSVELKREEKESVKQSDHGQTSKLTERIADILKRDKQVEFSHTVDKPKSSSSIVQKPSVDNESKLVPSSLHKPSVVEFAVPKQGKQDKTAAGAPTTANIISLLKKKEGREEKKKKEGSDVMTTPSPNSSKETEHREIITPGYKKRTVQKTLETSKVSATHMKTDGEISGTNVIKTEEILKHVTTDKEISATPMKTDGELPATHYGEVIHTTTDGDISTHLTTDGEVSTHMDADRKVSAISIKTDVEVPTDREGSVSHKISTLEKEDADEASIWSGNYTTKIASTLLLEEIDDDPTSPVVSSLKKKDRNQVSKRTRPDQEATYGEADVSGREKDTVRRKPSLKTIRNLKYVHSPGTTHLIHVEVLEGDFVVKRDLLQVNTMVLERILGNQTITAKINLPARQLLRDLLDCVQGYFEEEFQAEMQRHKQGVSNYERQEKEVPVVQMSLLDYARLSVVFKVSAVGRSSIFKIRP